MSGVAVVKAELVPAEDALARAGGFVGMDPTTPADYVPIAEIEIPDAPSYALRGVDLGAEFFDVDAGRRAATSSSVAAARR